MPFFLLALVVFGIATLLLGVFDSSRQRLPHEITIPAGVGLAGLLAGSAEAGGTWPEFARACAASLVGLALFVLIGFIAPHGLGGGDIALVPMLGLMLGYFGWGSVALGAASALGSAALTAATMLWRRRGSRVTTIAYGPFLLCGAWIGVIAGVH